MLQKLVVHGLENDEWSVDTITQLKKRVANFEWLRTEYIINSGKQVDGNGMHNYLLGVGQHKEILCIKEPDYGLYYHLHCFEQNFDADSSDLTGL